MEFMLMTKRNDVPLERWDHAADLYELGFKHAYEIAADLGVSPQTVMREMKRRGAVKGRRAHQTVAELEAFLDRRARRRAHERLMAETTAAQRRAAGEAVLERMIRAIVNADQRGDLSLAESDISSAASAFRVQTKGRSRQR